MDPRTGQFLGPNSTVAIGAIVPNTGNSTNGIFVAGQGITKTAFEWPAMALAPRFGMAYDVTGEQTLVVRAAAPACSSTGRAATRSSRRSSIRRTSQNVTVRYGQLQTLGAAV